MLLPSVGEPREDSHISAQQLELQGLLTTLHGEALKEGDLVSK